MPSLNIIEGHCRFFHFHFADYHAFNIDARLRQAFASYDTPADTLLPLATMMMKNYD